MEQQEERLKRLFQQLRDEDEQAAPRFDHFLLPVTGPHYRYRPAFRLAAAMLILALTVTLVISLSPSSQPTRMARAARAGSPAGVRVADVVVRNVEERPLAIPATEKRDLKQRAAGSAGLDRRKQRVPAISQWRSPTDFLLVSGLNLPGTLLLHTTPSVGQPLVELEKRDLNN